VYRASFLRSELAQCHLAQTKEKKAIFADDDNEFAQPAKKKRMTIGHKNGLVRQRRR
jgi:hypothetical protein